MPMLTYQQVQSNAAADVVEQQTTTTPENKRSLSELPKLTKIEIAKRRKLSDIRDAELLLPQTTKKTTTDASKETINGVAASTVPTTSETKKVGPAELASAFALASLVNLSPGASVTESREANVERKEKDFKDEVRKAASFESETRSPKASKHPLSPEQCREREQDSSEREQDNESTSSASKRVSFAPNTKAAKDSSTPSTPVSSKTKDSATSPTRKLQLMPHQSPRGMTSMMQMSPRPHRMYGVSGRGLPPHRFGYGGPPPPPHAPYHHPPMHRMGSFPGSFRHGPPPHHSPYGYMGAGHHRFLPPRQLMQPPLLHRTGSAGAPMGPPVEPPKNWVCDYCNVASFSSYEEACAHEEICKKHGPGAAALMAMSRSYSAASMDEESTASVPSSPMPKFHPGYHPSVTGMMARRHHASMTLKLGHQQRMQDMLAAANSNKPAAAAEKPTKAKSREEQKPMTEEERRRQEIRMASLGGYIVYQNDIEMIPPYVHFLMRQVEPCLFTEADRFVARSKGPVGYPGFQCRHCNGHAGLGKYFPVSSKSLSTNSTSQNIHAHMLKCRKCPDEVKDRLVQLKIEKSRSARMEPGWRKVFFDKVWERLHGKPPASESKK